MKLRLFSIVLILTLLMSCTQKYDTNQDKLQYNSPINTKIVLQSNPTIPAAVPPGISIAPTPTSISESPTPSISAFPTPPSVKISPTIHINTSTPKVQSKVQKKETVVYITRTGEKYHVSSCSYLRRSCIPIDLSDAKSSGYSPCSRCHPPR